MVVPSPATSEVLLATSFTICAPMFSSGSLSSISFATVTPSLVMRGEPNFLSRTTFRPWGPRVTLTASVRRLTPRRMAWRDSSPYVICFDMGCGLFFPVKRLSQHGQDFVLAGIRTSLPSIFTSVPCTCRTGPGRPTLTSSASLVPFSRILPLPIASTSPSCGFSLAVSG